MNIFFEIHKNNPREGPGNDESTERAYNCLPLTSSNPRILDVGCGPGKQTQKLAALSKGNITALDNHQPFLDQLNHNAVIENLDSHITTVNGDMFALDFADNTFDCIWAEGSIYIIGLEKGLKEWKRFLKPGGYMAVTHISWLKPDPPQEIREFWNTAYPAIRDVEENLLVIKECGYTLLDHFTLPEEAWWDYYTPVENRVKKLREKYKDDEEALALLDEESREIELYGKYSEWYGYEFFIMQRDRD